MSADDGRGAAHEHPASQPEPAAGVRVDPPDLAPLQRQKLILENRKLEREIDELKLSGRRFYWTLVPILLSVAVFLVNWRGQLQEGAKQRLAERLETARVAEEKYAQATGQLSSPNKVQRVQAVTYLAQMRDLSEDIFGRSLTVLCQQLESEPDPAVLEQVIWSVRQFSPDLATSERAGAVERAHALRRYDLVLRNVANANRRSASLLARETGRWIGARILEKPGPEAVILGRLQAAGGRAEAARLDPDLVPRARRELDVLASHFKRVPLMYEQNALAGMGVSFDLRDIFQLAGVQNRCESEISDMIFRHTLSGGGHERATDSLLNNVDVAGMHLAATVFCLRRLLWARGASHEQNDLQGVVLIPVDLSGANLSGMNLERAFIGARLDSANLDSCNLNSAIINGRMSHATSMRGATLAMTLFPESLENCRPDAIPALEGTDWRQARVGRIAPFDAGRSFEPPKWADCAPDTP